MKIALIKDQTEIINGYLNIINRDLSTIKSLDEYLNSGIELIRGDHLDFTDIVFDGEVEELIVSSLIEQIPNKDILTYLTKWIKILAIDGTISIGGIDVFETVSAVSFGKLNEQEINSLLYPKQACYSAKQIELELKELGLEIQSIKIIGFNYLILAKKVK